MTLPFENNLINNRYGLSDQSMNNEWSWTKTLGLAIVVSLHLGEVRGWATCCRCLSVSQLLIHVESNLKQICCAELPNLGRNQRKK